MMITVWSLVLLLATETGSAEDTCICDAEHPYCYADNSQCYAHRYSSYDDVSTTCQNCTGPLHHASVYAQIDSSNGAESYYACNQEYWGGPSGGHVQCQIWCDTDARCNFFTLWKSASNWCRLSSSCETPDLRPQHELIENYKKITNLVPGSNLWMSCGANMQTCDGVDNWLGVTAGMSEDLSYCCCNAGYKVTGEQCLVTTTSTTSTTTIAHIEGSTLWTDCEYGHMSTCDVLWCCCDSWYEYDSALETCVEATTSTTVTTTTTSTTEPRPEEIHESRYWLSCEWECLNWWCSSSNDREHMHTCDAIINDRSVSICCCDMGYTYNGGLSCEATTTVTTSTSTLTTTTNAFVDRATHGSYGFALVAIICLTHIA